MTYIKLLMLVVLAVSYVSTDDPFTDFSMMPMTSRAPFTKAPLPPFLIIQLMFKKFNPDPIFLSVFKTIVNVQMLPPDYAMALASVLTSGNITNFVDQVNNLDIMWHFDCRTAMQYLGYLTNSFFKNVQPPLLTPDSLKQFLPCQPSCNFVPLFKANFVPNPLSYIREIVPLLRPNVAGQCGRLLSQYIGSIPPPTGPADVQRQLNGSDGSYNNIGSMFRPLQFAAFNNQQVLGMLQFLSNIPKNFARVLGPKLASNTSLANAIKVLSFAPVNIIYNANAQDIINNIGSMDLDNMDKYRKSLLVRQVMNGATSQYLKTLMQTGDRDLINSIPLNQINLDQIGINSISPLYLPNAVLQKYGRLKIAAGLNTVLNDPTTLARCVASLRPSDFKNISNSSKINSVINVLVASMNSTDLNSVQRQSLYNTLINGAMQQTNSSDPLVFFTALNQTHFEDAAVLFVEAPSSHLLALTKIDTVSFGYILSSLSSISISQCISFTYISRVNFTNYATQYLISVGNKTTLDQTDLATLGPCFAPTISLTQFSVFLPSEFESIASYFTGVQFQPDSQWINKISNNIKSLISGLSSTDDLVNNLGETIIYYANVSTDAKIISSLATYGSVINDALKSSKNLQNELVLASRLGLGDNSALSAACKAFQQGYIASQMSSLEKSRRKRDTCNSDLTCEVLQDLSPDALSASQISQICTSEFIECVEILGASSNAYSADQISALATQANNAYSPTSSTTDSTIQSLNKILLGYTSTQLSSLTLLSTATTVQILGSIGNWNSDQLSSLIGIIRTNLGISNVLGSLGNLACGLTSNDFSSLTQSQISLNMPTFKLITNAPCPSLSTFYNYYKNISAITTLDSGSVADMNGLAGGALIADILAMDPEVFLSFSPIAIKNMPAETVNQLPSSILSLLSTAQLSAFVNSPYYASFNSRILSSLSALTNGQAVPTVSATTPPTSSSAINQINMMGFLLSLVMGVTYKFITY